MYICRIYDQILLRLFDLIFREDGDFFEQTYTTQVNS